jgi:serine protease Do
MHPRVIWPKAFRAVALLAVLSATFLAGAYAVAPGQAVTSGPAPQPTGALPESYPWPRLAEQLMPAVVNIRTTAEAPKDAERGPHAIPEPFRRFLPPELQDRLPDRQPRRGLGTGFIIDASGLIVTNQHVVDGVKTLDVTLSDGRKVPGKVLGTDPDTDLALVKVEMTGLPTVPFGRSAEMKVGEAVMAIGNPFGLDHTVTVGVISGKSRVIGGRFDDFLQTDAAINPGNSGGPVVNTRGQVVGIASAIASRSGGFQGVGFAIPSDLAQPILGQLRTAGKVTRGWLGVSAQPLTPELAKSFGVAGDGPTPSGALVSTVVEGSPAAKAGVRTGDVIMRFDGKPVNTPKDLSSLVAATPVGKSVEVNVVRDGKPQALTVAIGDLVGTRQAQATEEPRKTARLGLEVRPITPDMARRGGPSEGLVVTAVKPGSPAAEAGIVPGEVIREINRVPVDSLDDLDKSLAKSSDRGVLLRVEAPAGGARYVVVQAG